MSNIKNNTNESIYEIETDSQTEKTDLELPKRKGGTKIKNTGLTDTNYYK